jgi:hypothetical protein
VKSFLFSLCCIIASIAQAQVGGNAVFQSLNINPSARQAGIGGNIVSAWDSDPSLALSNPALLDSLMHRNLSLSYVNYFADINLGFASYVHRIDTSWTISGSVQFVSYGKQSQRDETGLETGEFSAGDYAFIAGASKRIDSLFSIGVNAKFLYGTIGGFSSSGAAMDIAGSYLQPKRKLGMAMVIRNLGYQFNYFSENLREKLPLDIQVGITKELKYAPLRFNLTANNLQRWDLRPEEDEQESEVDPITGEVIETNDFVFGDLLMRHITVGAEILVSSNMQLRFGYNYKRRQEMKLEERPGTAGFSWGFGFRIKKMQFNYGRSVYHLAGPSNHFTLSMALGS